MFFKDIEIGKVFFDTHSGDYYVKTDNDKGECVSGGSFFEGLIDTFDLEDIVELTEGE